MIRSGVPLVPSQSAKFSGIVPSDPRQAPMIPTGIDAAPDVFCLTRTFVNGGSGVIEGPPEEPLPPEARAAVSVDPIVIGCECEAAQRAAFGPANSDRFDVTEPVFALVCVCAVAACVWAPMAWVWLLSGLDPSTPPSPAAAAPLMNRPVALP